MDLRRILTEVTPLQRYLAEEIATDHLDGLLTRREAMRRLALLGMAASSASTLIAACSAQQRAAEPPVSTATPTPSTAQPPGMAHALPTSPITWAGTQGQLQG